MLNPVFCLLTGVVVIVAALAYYMTRTPSVTTSFNTAYDYIVGKYVCVCVYVRACTYVCACTRLYVCNSNGYVA